MGAAFFGTSRDGDGIGGPSPPGHPAARPLPSLGGTGEEPRIEEDREKILRLAPGDGERNQAGRSPGAADATHSLPWMNGWSPDRLDQLLSARKEGDEGWVDDDDDDAAAVADDDGDDDESRAGDENR